LWVIIITATIVSFVVYFTPNRGSSGGRAGSEDYGSINGERVTRDNYLNTRREEQLHYFFANGQWPDAGAKRADFDLEQETYFRLLLIQKEKELGIRASSEAVGGVASMMLRSLNRNGSLMPLDTFVEKVLQPQGIGAADFERFIRNELGIQQLREAIGLSGQLIAPQEIRALYQREHEELSVEAVFFSASNHLAGVPVTSSAVAQFYTNQMANYRVPDRVQVSYVWFNVTNFLAQAEKEMATNLTELVEANARQLGTNYYGGAKSPAESKAKLREALIRVRAMGHAREQANDFANILFKQEPVRAENLETLAKEKGLAVKVSAPFTRLDGPKDLAVEANFVKAAFALTADESLAGPFVGEDGVYVIALNKLIPSAIPPLNEIRDQVATDYKYEEAVQLARRAGTNFVHALTNGLAGGKTFSALCAEFKNHSVLLPPISISTRALPQVEDHTSLNEFKQAAFSTPPGQAGDFFFTAEGGFVVFVQSRLPLDEARMKADLPAFADAVRQNRRNETFNTWFREQLSKGLRDTPLARQQARQGSAGLPRK
jgi:parvulin-like peptidyl-prolyl isomerase